MRIVYECNNRFKDRSYNGRGRKELGELFFRPLHESILHLFNRIERLRKAGSVLGEKGLDSE